MNVLNETHDPKLTSWVEAANASDCQFPIQNLPFAVFRPSDEEAYRIGVAIGESILDLRALSALEPFQDVAASALNACRGDTLNELMALDATHWSALRRELSRSLRKGAANQSQLAPLLSPQATASFSLPAHIGDYTDFYISRHHAQAVGALFRPDNPLLPNYQWVPIGYHGRASSINVSGTDFFRPIGQIRPATEDQRPTLAPSQRLDYELELGIFIGTGNNQGRRIDIDEAESYVFGLCLLNDWSARDLQAWEYQPLGPFLAKNFASTISPWIVTLEALAPFRTAFERTVSDPAPLPYLSSDRNQLFGAFDVQLEVAISTHQSRAQQHQPHVLARSNFKEAYWTISQLVAHHTVNGCNLRPGDLLGTGTLSGPSPGQEGCLLERTGGGKQALKLPWEEERTFLEDYDEVILRARCSREGHRSIGFGECSATVLPAV